MIISSSERFFNRN